MKNKKNRIIYKKEKKILLWLSQLGELFNFCVLCVNPLCQPPHMKNKKNRIMKDMKDNE